MRKFLFYILIIATITGVLAPALASARTTDLTANLQGKGISWKNCTFGVGDVMGTAEITGEEFDFTKCVAMISYNILYRPAAAIFWFSGQIFDISIHYSIDKTAFDSELITSGWKATRDFVNLFFIFILLYIAIATILQLGGYGIKDLLVKVLIIALLVNFSLMICRVIIDASNILAWEFYNKASVEGGGVTTSVFGSDARDLSAVFLKGFNPQNLVSVERFDLWVNDTSGSSLVIIVLFALGAIMSLVGTFVLFSGAVLFVIRIAVLWLIMMLAPLAFLAMALPKTKAYASQWWEKLFNQSFFAPAFLFLIYLVALLVGGRPNADPPVPGILDTIFSDLSNQVSNANLSGLEGFFASLVTIFIYFIIMVVLMVGALIIARDLGAKGGKMVMDWGQSARGWAQGYAGRIARAPARRAGEFATGVAGRASERVLASDNWAARFARRVPGVARVASRTGEAARQDIQQAEERLRGLSDSALKVRASAITTSAGERAAAINLLATRNNLNPQGRFGNAQVQQATQILQRSGRDIRPIQNLQWQYATTVAQQAAAIPTVNPQAAQNLNLNYFNPGAATAPIRNAMYSNFHHGQINNILDRPDAAPNNFFNNLRDDTITALGPLIPPGPPRIGDLIFYLTDPAYGINNPRLAAWANSPPGQNVLRTYGFV